MATKEVKAGERAEGRGGMRTGALVLGIIAGLAGLASAVFALSVRTHGRRIRRELGQRDHGPGLGGFGLLALWAPWGCPLRCQTAPRSAGDGDGPE